MGTSSQNKQFRIGTRGSLLAVTQCQITKEYIEANTPLEFSIKTIKTQGDLITDKPLWQLDGKDFFTKELDHALLEKSIDLVIHSYKDLGSERPPGISLACITERKFPHDILLVKKSTISKLASLKKFRLGTSSPRRQTNLNPDLQTFLPGFGGEIEPLNLRGNVNTRIEKLINDDYDGIVLAFAGLERLAQKEESRKVLKDLIKDLEYMVLPVKHFPPAASQGALAIEVNEESEDLKAKLAVINHVGTIEEIKRERKAFQSYGGGCHLAVGVHVKKVQDYFVHVHKGMVDSKQIDHLELEGFDYSNYRGKSIYFMFKDFDFLLKKIPLPTVTDSGHLFITSSLCFDQIKNYDSLWTAGNRTMRKLIEKGHWVRGSAEGFGHQQIMDLKDSKFIQLSQGHTNWKILSHESAESDVGDLVACYHHQINKEYSDTQLDLLLNAEMIYWSSIIQYDAYTKEFPELKSRLHACGLGKTYNSFKERNINPIPCIDMNHLKKEIEVKYEL